jgi:hypothetical protein
MRSTTRSRIAALAVALTTFVHVQAARAAIITATASNRAGNASAFDGIGTPSNVGFELPNNTFGPSSFNDCAVDGGRTACMSISSSFIDLLPNNLIHGFQASGTISAVKPAGAGHATVNSFLSVNIAVSGVPAGQVAPFRFNGSLNESGASGVIQLTGPSTNMLFNSTTAWDQTLSFANGIYTLSIDVSALLLTPAAGTQSLGFSVKLEKIDQIPPSCTGNVADCFSAHAAPGCDDQACCVLICDSDPFCCDSQWDTICVGEAGQSCTALLASGDIINPLTGHRYRRLSPGSLEAQNATATGGGLTLASVGSLAENAWLRTNVATGDGWLNTSPIRIGLTRLSEGGPFEWLSGEPVTFTHWSVGEPGSDPADTSTLMDGSTGTWFAAPGSAEEFAITEFFFDACGQGDTCFGTHGPGCSDESCCNDICSFDAFCCTTSWDHLCVSEANQFCQTVGLGVVVNPATHSTYFRVTAASASQVESLAAHVGGHLVSIDSAAENEWLRLNFMNLPSAPSQIWIGAHDTMHEGNFRWRNSLPLVFAKWAPGEPNNANNNEDAAVMTANGLWNDVPNFSTISGIVEINCFADLNDNGSVDGGDLGVLLGAWGTASATADLNVDGIVDGADLAMFLGAWGPCPTSNACIAHPTPGSDQPGCTQCVCAIDPFCCQSSWDGICVGEAANQCVAACQCGQ